MTSQNTPDAEGGVETPSESTKAAQEESSLSGDAGTEADPAPHSALLPLFKAHLPLLRARVDNLEMAQMLVEGAREGRAMQIFGASLGA